VRVELIIENIIIIDIASGMLEGNTTKMNNFFTN